MPPSMEAQRLVLIFQLSGSTCLLFFSLDLTKEVKNINLIFIIDANFLRYFVQENELIVH